MSRIVSVQDISCFGQCSTTVALPIISAYGIETCILPSGILSAHTGCFKDFTYHDLTDEMPKIISHWKREKITFDAIFTGYIGDVRQFDIIKNMKDMLNTGGLLIVDPAMADNGKLYSGLADNIVDGMRSLVSVADVILPNITEASLLLRKEYDDNMTEQDVKETLEELTCLGPSVAILTGVTCIGDSIGAAAYNRVTKEYMVYTTRREDKNYPGTGDVFSSVAVAMLVNGASLYDVLKASCDFVYDCIEETIKDPTHTYGVKFEQVLASASFFN